jgi:hypothetical protein
MFYREGKSVLRVAVASRERIASLDIVCYLRVNEPVAVTAEGHARFRTNPRRRSFTAV